MLPFIVGGGVVVGVAVLVFKKQKCSTCDSYLTLNEPCLLCGKEVCGDHGKDLDKLGRCCKKHGDIDSAMSKQSSVEVFSKNYKGKVSAPRFSRTIETAFYDDKDDAERALRFIAAISGVEVVQGVEFKKDTGQRGNFQFSIWKASGTI